MSRKEQCLYQFSSFELDLWERHLVRDQEVIPLSPKVFDTLVLLVENSGHILDKDELLQTLWPNTFVEEHSLTQNISVLRKALGETGELQFIQTVPKRGYRFVADVRKLDRQIAEWVVKGRSETRIVVQEEVTKDTDNKAENKSAVTSTLFLGHRPSTKLLGALALTLFACTLLAVYYWRSGRQSAVASGFPIKSISVLPFTPLTTELSDEQLQLGLADALITKLSALRQLQVRPTTSVLKYRGTENEPTAVGRELGVDAVLYGTMQRVGNRVRVTVQLVRVHDGTSLWGEKFDTQLEDILEIQDKVSEQVVQALAITLTTQEQDSLKKRNPSNPYAYQAYVRGRYFWNKRSEQGLRLAAENFQEALEIDPSYALAYAGLADCYLILASAEFISQKEGYQKAEAAASQALKLDDSLAEAHTSVAFIKDELGDPTAAGQNYLRAIALNPNYSTAHHWYAWHLMLAGRANEAIAEMKKAQELDPLSPAVGTALAQILYYNREYDQALKQMQQMISLDPHHYGHRTLLGMAFEQKGAQRQAITEFQEVLKHYPNNYPAIAALAHTQGLLGMKHDARQALAKLTKRPDLKSLQAFEIGVVYAALRENDNAFLWFEKIRKTSSLSVKVRLRFDPRLDRIRQDPRFQSLLEG